MNSDAPDRSGQHSPGRIGSALLLPLAGLYGAAAGLKNLAYDRAWLKAKRLRIPVISVGNLSVGGAGKTPVVIRLAELLAERGVRVSVLSRGYGREGSAVEVVDPAGSADRFGDEPLLIARTLASANYAAATQVVVGADRHAAGLLAEAAAPAFPTPRFPNPAFTTPDGSTSSPWPPQIHILDDGFQHRRLARDLDIVLLHRSDLESRLLPAGRLRERLSSLRRASIIVLREEDSELIGELHTLLVSAHLQPEILPEIWYVQRSVSLPKGPQRFLAFCGIAHPTEFFQSVEKAGKTVVGKRAFPDHHPYTADDLASLQRLAADTQAEAFVTTAKDAIRLSQQLFDQRGSPQFNDRKTPLIVADLRIKFRDEDAVLQELLRVAATGF